jgi:hypothetical protein
LIIRTICDEQYRSYSYPLRWLLQCPLTSSLLGPNNSLSMSTCTHYVLFRNAKNPN